MIQINIEKVASLIRQKVAEFRQPIVTQMANESSDPFLVLIATLLSLRTRDEQTRDAANRLFAKASTPLTMVELSEETIASTIYPVGFYRTKARTILLVCRILIERYNGQVPSDLDRLLELPGVGRKTANLVVTRGFNLPGICVDTHVHRISNRLGFVTTKTPEETEMVLRHKLPQSLWIEYNDLLVAFGQNLCAPISPRCSICPIFDHCMKSGVTKHR